MWLEKGGTEEKDPRTPAPEPPACREGWIWALGGLSTPGGGLEGPDPAAPVWVWALRLGLLYASGSSWENLGPGFGVPLAAPGEGGRGDGSSRFGGTMELRRVADTQGRRSGHERWGQWLSVAPDNPVFHPSLQRPCPFPLSVWGRPEEGPWEPEHSSFHWPQGGARHHTFRPPVTEARKGIPGAGTELSWGPRAQG